MDSMSAFAMGQANRGKEMMVFDWVKAARLITELRATEASAGLSGDWDHTGDDIFRDGLPYRDGYTFLSSTWATPELCINGEYFDCFVMKNERPDQDADTKWPEDALAELGCNQPPALPPPTA